MCLLQTPDRAVSGRWRDHIGAQDAGLANDHRLLLPPALLALDAIWRDVDSHRRPRRLRLDVRRLVVVDEA